MKRLLPAAALLLSCAATVRLTPRQVTNLSAGDPEATLELLRFELSVSNKVDLESGRETRWEARPCKAGDGDMCVAPARGKELRIYLNTPEKLVAFRCAGATEQECAGYFEEFSKLLKRPAP